MKEAYEQEIGLKMLRIAILETRIFKIFWGNMPPGPLDSSLAPTAIVVSPLLKIVDPPLTGTQCFREHRHSTH